MNKTPELYCHTCDYWRAPKGKKIVVGECCYKGSDFFVRGASAILMVNEKHYCTSHELKEELAKYDRNEVLIYL